jgi:hypothetical protein
MSTPPDELGGLTELVLGTAYQRVIALPNPPAGQGWTVTVPGGVAWRLLTAFTRLSCSAVAATRYPALTITDGTTQLCRLLAGGSAAASGVLWSTWAIDAPITSAAIGSSAIAPIPGKMILMPGWVIALVVSNMDAGDTMTYNSLLVSEYRLGPPPPRSVTRDLSLIE